MCITHVDSDNCNGKGCYKYGNVQIWSPVLYDNSGGRKVVREDNRIFEKVIPTCGIPRMGKPSPVVEVLINLPQSWINKSSCVSSKTFVRG